MSESIDRNCATEELFDEVPSTPSKVRVVINLESYQNKSRNGIRKRIMLQDKV